MATVADNETIRQKLPQFVLDAASILRDGGFEAYLVGGSVRDILINKEPKDYDIATNARPEEVEKIFPKSIPTGVKFGTMLVILPDKNGENQDIEITTYRSEAEYFGGRWPSKVEFTTDIEEDLSRRDFTINAIALRLDDDSLTKDDVRDPFDGLKDLKAGLIRAVGDPLERFSEDGLRSIRGCRLAANLGFKFEDKTFAAISETLTVTKHVSMERVRDELLKLLHKSPKPSIGLELMRKSGLLELFIPELLEGIGINQPQYHVDDVFTHTLKTVDLAEDSIKLAALFHDIGKPRTKSEDEKGIHFYGHDVVGADMTKAVMKRLKFSNAEIDRTYQLVRWHMFYYPNADWRKDIDHGVNHSAEVKVLVMRHGQTDDNVNGILSGQNDPELNTKGREQVSQIGNVSTDVIISSPLKRALQSAEIIAEGKAIQTDDRFKNRHLGELQGLTWKQFEEKYPDLVDNPDNSPNRQEYLPNGESISHVESRVKVALFNHIKSNLGKTILIVTHAGIIRVIKRQLSEIDEEASRARIGNAEIIEFTVKLADLDPNFLSDNEIEILRQAQSDASEAKPGGWTDGAVRRFIRNVGGEDLIEDLMKLRISDATSNSMAAYNPQELNVLSERIAAVRADDMALKVTDLEVNGHDMMEIGITGSKIGSTLSHLLELVIDDPLLNAKEKLLELAKNTQTQT